MKRMKTVCSVLLVGLSLPGLALENAYATPVETAMTQTQDRKVAFTGTVQDSKGEAIVGATILVKGQAKGKGTLTDPKGHFVLSGLKVGSELVISCVGYKTQTVRWTGTPLSITLEDEMTQLSGVVVTALGIRREKKALGYAMQEVKGDQLMAVREPNITNALSGKVSGIQIIKGSSSPGSSSKIVLRGNSSLSGSNQPLIVVDGVPMDNTTGATNNDFWNPAADMGNGLSDINAEDIESMTVLKGASAAALDRKSVV